MVTYCDVPAFWLDYKDMVYAYIKRRVTDEEIAKDLTQEVLLKIYRFCSNQCGIKNKRAWLFDISHNIVIDYLRKNKESVCIDKMDIPDTVETDVYESISQYIRPLLECLPEKYAEALKLDLDGVNQKDIADILQLNLSATKSRVQRSRQLMKGLMFECFDLELDNEGRMNSFQVKSDCEILRIFHSENSQNISG